MSVKRVLILAAAVLCACAPTANAAVASGDIDTTFAASGFAVQSAGEGDWGEGVARQSDGKLLVVDSGDSNNIAIRIYRYTVAGLLDTGFGGGDGIATTPINPIPGYNTGIGDLAIDSQGRIIVAGVDSSDDAILVARFLSNGDVDTSWGGPAEGGNELGMSETTPLGYTQLRMPGLAIMANGDYVVAGRGKNGAANFDGIVQRCTEAAGCGVSSFSVYNNGSNNDEFRDVAVLPDGTVAAVGGTGTGTVNPIQFTDATRDSLVALFDGSTLLPGATAVADVSGGSRDDRINAIHVEGSGKVLTAGTGDALYSGGPSVKKEVALRRWTISNASTTPAIDGSITTALTPFGATTKPAVPFAVDEDAAGRIVVTAATEFAPSNLMVARFTSVGALDTTFGGGAGYVTPGPQLAGVTSNERDAALLIQPDGRIVVASQNVADGSVVTTRLFGSLTNLSTTAATSPASVTVGQNQTVTFTVANAGPDAATGATVRVSVPAGMTVVSSGGAAGGCTTTSGTATCPLGTIASGASASATFVVRLAAAGHVTMTGTAAGTLVDTDSANDAGSTTVTAAAPTTTKLTLNAATKSGRKLRCGTTARRACAQRHIYRAYVRGTEAPKRTTAATRRVTIKVYRKVGRKWKLVRTSNTTARTTGAYGFTYAAGALPMGLLRIQSSVAKTTTTTAATSAPLYLRVS